MSREQECYGKMFPSAMEMSHNKLVAGKVFGYEVDYPGLVAHKREATVDGDAWQKCLECRDLDGWLLSSIDGHNAHGARGQDNAANLVLRVSLLTQISEASDA